MRRLRKHLSYANVMATVAIFVALGGSAYAFQLGKNSVKSKNIAKGAVKTSDLAKGAVTRSKIHAGAIPAGAIANDSIGAAQLRDVVARTAGSPLNDNSNAVPEIRCNPGEQAIAGGIDSLSADADVFLGSSLPRAPVGAFLLPSGEFDGWGGNIHNAAGGAGDTTANAYVICLK